MFLNDNRVAKTSIGIMFFSFVLYTFCFVAILLFNPPYVWSGLDSYIQHTLSSNQSYKYIGMFLMLIFGLAFMVFAHSIARRATPEKEIFAVLSQSCATIFCALISIAYFVQITAARFQTAEGYYQEMAQLTQTYQYSLINSINMLGWTVFYGLSSFFLAMCMQWKNAKALTIALYVNGIVMSLGLIGYVSNDVSTIVITMNVGLGVTTMAVLFTAWGLLRKNHSGKI